MTSFKDPNTRRELVMKHYSTPLHKGKLEETPIDVYSKQCVDELHLYIKWDGDKASEVKWDGLGCAIFQSSTDIFTDMIIGKTKSEIKTINDEFVKLINGNEVDEELLKELTIYDNVGKQLNRLHCAEMITIAIEKAL